MKKWNKSYVESILEPYFRQAKAHFFLPMLEVNRAHALMLFECGFLTLSQTQALLRALRLVKTEKFKYSTRFEDLFFALEDRLKIHAGSEAAGNLHIARSRNDLDAALIRMVLRLEVLKTQRCLSVFASVLQQKALESVEWLMPGYTHHQPAQPTTLGHYLAGVLSAILRNFTRLEAAYTNINQSPLGVAAMTGTGFAINRARVATLLGFDRLIENGIDAVGAADYSLEMLSVLQIAGNTALRLLFDLQFWASQELGFFRIADGFIQQSSIMPQKRNPVVLEHIRARLAKVTGAVSGAFAMTSHIPFGDVNDVAEPLLPLSLAAHQETRAAFDLLAQVLLHSSFDQAKMHQAAHRHMITATGLADGLVQKGLHFKEAHRIVSRTVDLLYERGGKVSAALVQEAANYPLAITDAWVEEQLEPRAFIERRVLSGGSAPKIVRQMLQQAGESLKQSKRWQRQTSQRLKLATRALELQTQAVLNTTSAPDSSHTVD